MKVQFERFHLNGHTTGFWAQTQMLEQLYHHHHHHMIPYESTALEVSFWMVTPQDLATDSMLEP